MQKARVAVVPLFLCTLVPLPFPTSAEEAKTDEQWLLRLRNSASYKKGLIEVRKNVEAVYDSGAVNGATHWEDIHNYYIELARATGCKKGAGDAGGPSNECPKVSKAKPELLGTDYKTGKDQVIAIARETAYPNLVRQVLLTIYDYGYVQGMKHGLRSHNDNLRWKQAYYKACVERAKDAKREPVCAEASSAWSEALLKRLGKDMESHGLPAGRKP